MQEIAVDWTTQGFFSSIEPKPDDHMLQIRKEHEQAFVDKARATFIAKTLVFLEQNTPDWCSTRTADEQRQFIEEILDFAHQRHIFKAINVQKLVYYKIAYEFEIFLSPYREGQLNRKAFDEAYRVTQLRDSLLSGHDMTVIKLYDDTNG
jgi:hypothetical protein